MKFLEKYRDAEKNYIVSDYPHGSRSAKEAVVKSGVAVLHFPNGTDYGKGNMVYLMIAIAAEHTYHLDNLMKPQQCLKTSSRLIK